MRVWYSSQSTKSDSRVSLYFKVDSVWTHFNNLDQDRLPTFEELFKAALSLYDNYSTPRAGTIFALGCGAEGSIVPTGEPWREEEDTEARPVPAEADGVNTEEGESSAEKGPEGVDSPAKDKPFKGDHVLMKSTLFMYEALVSKEVAQAVAEGDVGRVYEGIKVCTLLA